MHSLLFRGVVPFCLDLIAKVLLACAHDDGVLKSRYPCTSPTSTDELDVLADEAVQPPPLGVSYPFCSDLRTAANTCSLRGRASSPDDTQKRVDPFVSPFTWVKRRCSSSTALAEEYIPGDVRVFAQNHSLLHPQIRTHSPTQLTITRPAHHSRITMSDLSTNDTTPQPVTTPPSDSTVGLAEDSEVATING